MFSVDNFSYPFSVLRTLHRPSGHIPYFVALWPKMVNLLTGYIGALTTKDENDCSVSERR